MLAPNVIETPLLRNICRHLRELGLAGHVRVTGENRQGTAAEIEPLDFRLLEHMALNGWPRDPGPVSRAIHRGTRGAFREPHGVKPNMQGAIKPWPGRTPDGKRPAHRFEADLDATAPNVTRPLQSLRHGFMFLVHKVTGRKTDQEDIARMQDERFGKEKT